MKRFLLLCMALLTVIAASAYDFSVKNSDGITIYYNKNSNGISVSVTYASTYTYSGVIVIPSTVTYSGTTYSVTKIGVSAFQDCSDLTSVTIPTSVTEISNAAFDSCSGLTSVTIPNSVTSIGDWAFFGCHGLTTVYFNAEACHTMGRANYPVFKNCSNLTNVIFGENVRKIPSHAFRSCSGLTSVTIPNSVTSIGASAFRGCSGLTSVTIPNSVTSIGASAFCDCSGLTSVNFNATVCNAMGSADYPVFESCSNLTNVTFGEDVTKIPSYAFYGCSGLTSVTIPNSVTLIGSYAFYKCSGLKILRIEDGETELSLSSYQESTYVYYYPFRGCPIETLYVGRNPSTWEAFHNSSNLTAVEIGNCVTSIGDYAFNGCSGLTSVIIGNSVHSIGESAFRACKGLTSVTIPNSVASIGSYAFYGCSGLSSVAIPNSVTSIGYYAFRGCSGLTTVYFNAKACNSMGSANYPVFSDCSNLTYVIFGENVEKIPSYAFYGCSGPTSVAIPNSVTSIDSYAFNNCSNLKLTTIGSSVASIGEEAFYGCENLKTICNKSSLDLVIGSDSFGYVAYYASNIYTASDLVNDFYFDSDTRTLLSYGGDDINITLPDDYNGDSYSIGDYAFSGKPFYTITIPNKVTALGENAFYGCPSLTSVKIGSGVLEMSNNVFGNCPNLYKVFLMGNTKPKGIENAFASLEGRICYVSNDKYNDISSLGTIKKYSSLNSIFEVEGIKYIPVSMSARTCDAVDCSYSPETTKINIDATVLYRGVVFNVTQANNHVLRNNPYPTEVTFGYSGIVPDYSLSGCSKVKNLIIGGGISSFGTSPFDGLSELTSLTISESNTPITISDNALFRSGKVAELMIGRDITYNQGDTNMTYSPFSGMATLRSLKLNGYLTKVPERFFYASGTEGITVNCDATLNIYSYAFSNCINLTSIEFNESLTDIGAYAFSDCSNLSNIKFPNSLREIGKYAFSNCIGLSRVDLPVSLINLGEYAFSNCTKNSRVTFQNGLERIETGVFVNNTNLTNIVFSSTIKSIGQEAFSGADPESLRFPASVDSIGVNAFKDCANIQTIRFDDSAKALNILFNFNQSGTKSVYIGRNFENGQTPFANNQTLESAELSNMVTVLNAGCFDGCSGLKVINIPSSVASVPDNAFRACAALENIDFPTSVTSIGANAFYASGLRSVTLAKCVNNVGSQSFYGCNNLQYASISAATIGESAFASSGLLQLDITTDVNSIGTAAFENCNKLQNATIGASTIGASAFNKCTSLVSASLDTRTKNIGASAFQDCSSLASINLPEGFTDMQAYTFAGTSSLSEIVLPQSLKSINEGAFKGSGLSSVKIPATVNSIGSKAFAQTSKLALMTLDDSNNAITVASDAFANMAVQIANINRQLNYESSSPFSGNNTLTSVSMNDKPTSLLTGMFKNCSALQSVTNSQNLTIIGAEAFRGCSSLTTVNIPSGVSKIQKGTFQGCSSLSTIELPGVKNLEEYSFAQSGLKSFVINPVLEQIALGSFQGCTSLEELVALSGSKTLEISNSESNKGMFSDAPLKKVSMDRPLSYSILKEYGYSPFYRLTSLKTVELGDYVPEVPDNMFYGCTGLTDVVIGDGVTSFGDYSFSGCQSIQRFYFGGNVESIGEEAFSDCSDMVELWSQAVNPPVCGDQALADIDKFGCELFVPLGTVDSYSEAEQWQDFLFTGESTGKTIMATGISLSKLSLSMKIDDTANIMATILPTSVQDNFPVTWSSSNESVAVVSNGKVTAVGEGECQIIATTQANGVIMSACNVSVDKLDQELMWVQAFGGVYIGDQITLKGKTDSGLDVQYTISGGDDAAVLNNNVLNIIDVGTIEITAYQPGNDRYHASNSVVRSITIIPINAKNITIENDITVHIGQTIALNAEIEPLNTYDKSVTWKSLDENLVTVDDSGVITGVYNGETYIVATASNGLMANCRVTVNSLGDDYLSIDDAEITARETWDMPVNLTNIQNIASVEFDVELPESISFVVTESGCLDASLSDRCPNHDIIVTLIDDRIAHFEVYSLGSDVFTGESGESLLTIPVVGKSSTVPVLVKLCNVKLYTETFEAIVPGTDNASITIVGGGLIGDVNNNGVINVADVMMVINAIIGVVQPNYDASLADVNNDGNINVSDVMLIIRYVIGLISEFPNRAPANSAYYAASANSLISISMDAVEDDKDMYTVFVKADNMIGFSGAQMDIELSDGFEYVDDSLELANQTDNAFTATNAITPWFVKMATVSTNLQFINNPDGSLMSFKVKRMSEEVSDGIITVSGIELVDAEGNSYKGKDATCNISAQTSAIGQIGEDVSSSVIYVEDQLLHIILPNAQAVIVSDLNGKAIIYDLPKGHSEIMLNSNNFYIVRTSDKTIKIFIK